MSSQPQAVAGARAVTNEPVQEVDRRQRGWGAVLLRSLQEAARPLGCTMSIISSFHFVNPLG
jgi:hypothetical protein